MDFTETLKILLNNYLEYPSGLLGIFISDNKGSIVLSEQKKFINEDYLSNLKYHNFIDELNQIVKEHHSDFNFLEIKEIEEINFCFCSLGHFIIAIAADHETTNIELKAYSISIAEKVELIQKGDNNISLSIPKILKIFSKTKERTFPKGEHSVKIVVIGDFKSGKSSIIRRLVENNFNNEYFPTTGFSISKKVLCIDGTDIKFSIWDSGGLSTQISPLKEKFYNHADAGLIVIDMSHSNNLKAVSRLYSDIISSVNKKIPIIIAGNKSDLNPNQYINEDNIKEFAKNNTISYIPISAKTGKNINKLFIELTHQIINSLSNSQIRLIESKYKKYHITLEEVQALEDLEEKIIENSYNTPPFGLNYNLEKIKENGIPNILEVDETSFGFKIQNERVIEIGVFNCGLTNLPESFNNFTSLQKIILRCNPLNILPEPLMKLKNIEIVDLALTNLKKISNSIGNLESVKELYLENNWFSDLPETFGNLKSLKILNLENNPINELPNSFPKLETLEILLLESAPFEPRGYIINLPKNFGNLKSLKELDLSSHKLKVIPESFKNLESLIKLELYNNKLKIIPIFFKNLKSLEILNLEGNLISVIHDELGNMTNLRDINIKDNFITPKEIAAKFKALAFKTTGKQYDRLMRLAESIENQERDFQRYKYKTKNNKKLINILAPIIYAFIISFIGLITFLSVDIISYISNSQFIWILFFGALIINFLVGSSIISTFSVYFKISISKFNIVVQRTIFKIFEVLVLIILVWGIRAAILAGMNVELIPAINFLFKFTIPDWLITILITLGYNINLTFLKNLDLFLGHFYIKLFSTALVFWALYRNGLSYIKKTAFDESGNKNLKLFLIFGLFGALWLAIMNYSSLKSLLSIGYFLGVSLGACIFMWEKNNDNKRVFYYYMTLIITGIFTVWIISLYNIIISFLVGIVFVMVFLIIQHYAYKN